jgi:hypothetical protein
MFSEIISTIREVVEIVDIIISVLEKLGILENNMSAEELGTRKLLAEEDGFLMDQFDSIDAYIKFLENYEVDEKKASNLDEQEIAEAGYLIINQVLKEKFDFDLTETVGEILVKNSDFFGKDRLTAYLEEFKNSDVSFNNFADALSGKIKDSSGNILETAINAEKRYNPDISDEQASNNIGKIKG